MHKYNLNVDLSWSDSELHDFVAYLSTVPLEVHCVSDKDKFEDRYDIFANIEGRLIQLNPCTDEDGAAVLVAARDDGKHLVVKIDCTPHKQTVQVCAGDVTGKYASCIDKWHELPKDNITWKYEEDTEGEE